MSGKEGKGEEEKEGEGMEMEWREVFPEGSILNFP